MACKDHVHEELPPDFRFCPFCGECVRGGGLWKLVEHLRANAARYTHDIATRNKHYAKLRDKWNNWADDLERLLLAKENRNTGLDKSDEGDQTAN